MPLVPLSTPINNVYTTVAAPGYSSVNTPTVLPVANGSLFGSPTSTAPVRLTVIQAGTYGTTTETLNVYKCTAVDANTLTVEPIISGPDAGTNRDYVAGDIVEVRITAGTIADLNDSVVATGLPTTGLTITQWVGAITTINCTSAKTAAINCTNASAFVVNLYSTGGAHTFTLTGLAVGQTVKLTIVQGATAGTVTWSGAGNQPIAWSGGTAPTLATVEGHMDTITLYCPVSGTIGGAIGLSDYIAP